LGLSERSAQRLWPWAASAAAALAGPHATQRRPARRL